MAHISSKCPDVSPNVVSTDLETSLTSAFCEEPYPGDLNLKSLVEENAFQAFCEVTLIKRPCYTVCASETDEDNYFITMTFPRKLWRTVESVQLKSIWSDKRRTSTVINERPLEREVLERSFSEYLTLII